MKIKFSNLVKMFLAGACFVAVGCNDYDQDIKNLNNRIDAIESNNITPLKADLAAVIADLEAAKSDLQDKIDANNATISDLEEALNEAKSSNAETIEDILANIETLGGKIDDLKDADEQFEADINDIELAIANLQAKDAEFAEFQAAYDLFVERVDTKLGELQAEIDLLKQKDVELTGLIDALDTRLKLNEELAAKNQQDIAATIETLNGLNDAHLALSTKVDGLEESFNTYQENIREELNKHFGAFTTYTEKTDKALADILAEIEAQKILIEANATKEELAEAKKELQDNIDATNEALDAYKTEMEGIIKGLEDKIAESKDAIEVDPQAISELQGLVSELNNKVNALNDQLQTLSTYVYETLSEDIKALKGDLSALMGRTQSLVFVPKYVDGKGTINFAKAGETVVESRSQAEYQVYPAECANAIISTFDPENPILSFDNKYLTTRSNELSFDVVAVEKGSQEGRILVTFEPRGLDAEFYAGNTKEYALSLVLNNGTANLSSPYTNFVRAKKADKIGMAIMFEGKAVSGSYTVYEFEYTDVENPRSVLENHYVKFTVGNKSYDGIAALNAAGYDVNLTSSIYTHREYNKHLALRPFVVEEDDNGVLKVWVNEIKRELIRQPIEVGYEYALGTLNAKAYATVQTVPVQATIAYEAIDINWTYADDIAVDAARYAAKNAVYSRKNLILGAQENNLPADIDLVKALTSTLTKTTVTLNGEEVAVDAAFVLDAENNVKINLSGFEWDKTYEVASVYNVKDAYNQVSAVVTVKVTVNTHDRSRDIIEVKLAEEDWMLTRNFQYQSETAVESLETIYEQAKSYLPEATTAEMFLKNIFVDNAFDFENKANGEAEEFTQLVIENDGTEVKSVYNVNDFAKIPEAVEYVYNITTWYGQEIVITKTLNTGLAPVEITLPTVTKTIVKDLEFFTDADSLAEIFTNATRVKEGEFTANEYLAAIFTDHKFRPKRAQKDLANGVELANTKLVVDPKTGAIIKAAYSYTDFTEVAPLTVNYQTTYTTWYGQEIIINKVINFEFPAYDFKHNPHYVYGADYDFYSQVLPEYTWNNNNEADGLLMFDVAAVDLRSAFSVVEGKVNKLTAEQMAELGLVFNFVIEDEEHYGITIDPATDKLSYYGGNPFVNVRGNLYIVNSNNSRYTVPTSFDEGGNYASYRVLKFNPIATAELDETKSTTIKVDNAIKYHVHVLDYIKLYDYRVGGRQSYPLIKDGAWVTGDGKNGFADGVDVRADYIYRISEVWSNDTKHLDADIRPFITLNNGTLTFDNTQQLELTAPFKVPVTLKFQNCWMEKPDEVTVVFTFNPIK